MVASKEDFVCGQERGELQTAFCANLTAIIQQAGGAGLLEVELCPVRAIYSLAPSATDSPDQAASKVELAGRLGITSFEEGELN